MRKRGALVRILSIALTISILAASIIVNPIQTKAGSTNGDNGDLNTSGGHAAAVPGTGWLDIRQGYRFYIIDSDYNRASDVYDFLFEAPSNVSTAYTNTRWESPSTDKSHWHSASINYLVSVLQQSVTPVVNVSGIKDIYPMRLLSTVYGEQFQQWFIGKEGQGSSVIGSSTSIRNPGSTSGNKNNNKNNTGNKNNGGSSSGSSETTDKLKEPAWLKKGAGYYKSKLSKDEAEQASQLLRTLRKQISLLSAAYIMQGMSPNDIRISVANDASDMFYDKYGRNIAYYLGCWASSNAEVACTNSTNILNQDIPLSSKSDSQRFPADAMMARQDLLKVYNFNEDVDNNDVVTALDALQYKENGVYKYFLVVEPLAWINIYRGWGKADSTRTYGTYFNLVEHMYKNVNNDAANGAHASYFRKFGKNSLVVKKSYTKAKDGIDMYAASDNSPMNISQVYSEMKANKGYGMQLYFAGMFPRESGTHTYDSSLGTTPGKAPDPSDLEEDSPDKGGNNITIIKNYVTENNGTEQTDGNYTRVENPHTILIEDEPNYTVVDWNTSTNEAPNIADGSKTPWSDVTKTSTKTKSGTSSTTVDLDKPEKVLYIKLKKADGTTTNNTVSGDWTLNESEITKVVDTGTRTTNQKAVYTYNTLTKNCTGHSKTVSMSSDEIAKARANGSTATTKRIPLDPCTWSMDDDSWTFRRINSNEASSPVIATGGHFTSSVTEIQKTRPDMNPGTVEADGFDYTFIISRHAQDKISLAGYSNKDNTLSDLGIGSTSAKTTKTRAKVNYTSVITIDLVDNNSDLDTHSVVHYEDSEERCDDIQDRAINQTPSISTSGTVAVKVYAGADRTPNTDLDTTPLKILTNIQNNMTAGRQVSSNGTITFNPYIKMTYQTLNSSNKNEVYVLSEYRRQIIPNDYAEIQWSLSPGNLLIQSQMWALDADLTKGDKDWNQKNQVLKGGATYWLTTPKTQKISLNTYQTITEGISRDNSTVTGDLTDTKARQYHAEFVNEAIQTYDSTNLMQYVDTNTKANNAYTSGIPVYNKADISSLNNGSSTASEESKYYLKEDDNNASNPSRGDLDVKQVGTSYTYYRFSSDTSGNIYMKKSDSLSDVNSAKGDIILQKTQGVSDIDSGTYGDAITINNRTGVIDKLLAAIERNTGNDTTASWAPDGHWYNEAYEGVIVLVQKTTIEVGFNNTTKRTTVLDPKLIPKLNSTSGQNLTAYLSQYCTDLDSTTPIATFKGNEVYMRNGNELFTTKKWYITNSTVQQ